MSWDASCVYTIKLCCWSCAVSFSSNSAYSIYIVDLFCNKSYNKSTSGPQQIKRVKLLSTCWGLVLAWQPIAGELVYHVTTTASLRARSYRRRETAIILTYREQSNARFHGRDIFRETGRLPRKITFTVIFLIFVRIRVIAAKSERLMRTNALIKWLMVT